MCEVRMLHIFKTIDENSFKFTNTMALNFSTFAQPTTTSVWQ